MNDQSWKDLLHDQMDPAWAREIDLFEGQVRLREQGKILHLGVSVEKVEEGLKAIEYPNVVSVQVIFNLFRQKNPDGPHLKGYALLGTRCGPGGWR